MVGAITTTLTRPFIDPLTICELSIYSIVIQGLKARKIWLLKRVKNVKGGKEGGITEKRNGGKGLKLKL